MTAPKLVIHPLVAAALERFVAEPSHSLLLIGPDGAGKTEVAQQLLRQLLDLKETTPLQNHPFFSHVQPKDGTISIDAIRGLREFTKLRTTGLHPLRRGVLISDAQTMTTEAQNAVLKLLEEPPADTVLILTTTALSGLLPTVTSRLPKIHMQAPPKETLLTYFADQGSANADIERAYHIADGQPGLMASLLHDDTDHPLVTHITTAKQLLQASFFERLTQVDGLAKQKSELPSLLFALRRICRAALQQAALKDRRGDVQRWNQALATIIQAEASLSANAGTKLLLTDLLLNL